MPISVLASQAAWSAFRTFTTCHCYWRLAQKGALFVDPKNHLQLGAGYMVDAFFGKNVVVQLASGTLLIFCRTIKMAEQKAEMDLAWQRCKKAFYGQQTLHVKVSWEQGAFFSTSSWTRMKLGGKRAACQIVAIALATLEMLKQVFILSMRVCDLIEALAMKSEDGVKHVFVNLNETAGELAKRRIAIKKILEENEKLIQMTLDMVYLPANAADVTQKIDATLRQFEGEGVTIVRDLLWYVANTFRNIIGTPVVLTESNKVTVFDPPIFPPEKMITVL